MRRRDDKGQQGIFLGNLGNAYAALGDAHRAITFHEQNLSIARELGDRQGESTASWNLGLQLAAQGQLAQAAQLMQMCVDYEQEIGHPDAEKYAARLAELRRRMEAGGEHGETVLE
ncbi:MAG: tetratricopeptide repeat-containing protein [Roseiflexaceae bacterium]|nr:tetratricopeptide repeat-containing protein [Roseiflexaceae bacterium]